MDGRMDRRLILRFRVERGGPQVQKRDALSSLPIRRQSLSRTAPLIHFSPLFQISWRSTSCPRGRRGCSSRARTARPRWTMTKVMKKFSGRGEVAVGERGRRPTSSSPRSSASSTTTDTGWWTSVDVQIIINTIWSKYSKCTGFGVRRMVEDQDENS